MEELRQQLEKQCLINQELQRQNKDLEQRLQEKEKLLQELHSQYHNLEFPPQRDNDVEPEVRKSRAAVIAPEPIPETVDIRKSRVKKTSSETGLIVKAIQKNDFLSRLDDEQIAMMVDLLETINISRGGEVIKEGSEGDSMYMVAAGELIVTQSGRVLRTLTSGDIFGELAILYNCKRTATVKAKTEVRLWCMERQNYRTIITNKSKKKREELMGFLKTSRTLKDLNDVQLSKIIDSMEEVKYQDKDVIVREGAEGNTFYIILKGEVLVTKNVNGHQKQIRRMGKGEHFGEQALIREVLRTATCAAEGPVTCFSIDKEVFEETIPVEQLELFDDSKMLQEAKAPAKSSPSSTLRFKDLVPVLYQEGRYQGDPVTLGVGGFGRVELMTTLNYGKYYAIKRVSKKHIVAKRQEEHMLLEKKILKAVQCDFIVRLHAAFKDTRYIYMVMDFCGGGEIWTKLKEVGRFDEQIAIFCTSCVVEAYAYLHKKSIMYRDLKPENLMLDVRGYVKLVDFGFAKELVRGEKTYSFVGTPEYMAPEIIKNQGHDFAVDFWSLGILIYELLVGSPPFSSSEPQKIYSKILDGVLSYPPYLSEAAKSIISKLCRPRPGQRLGNTKNGIKDVRSHRWFGNMNWHKLRMAQLDAPTVRLIRKGPCYINFDRFPQDQTKADEEFSGWDRNF
ncbi:cGMP-dependent protein kinase 1 isoform X1 [Entelurus aequoreus]|uniref:cGMP-dependent protein kinase 1 isoform X1 n=1 Tax=Entelurus aequoreus TaxID=161455 RepID=UPI002B1E3A75|nr:cGMP-dependent protein kinase 1 isoform X1 [Entelurus aequoreus]XP_061890846.1 cGMP-dependent protein kinase 1 isoform X1 [Entelurus aequoreus]XP_061890847.1 cGMP-dependent protein kinase 1 isoform X1 [Entelurus aequoreus]XP_061890848.1 cGMP-dependent protein kinase 1 isoform X1 [Entelurus aequoreus]XP_061890850.1 cGMP-dependent protein kinase 1 isoform X1 [Entelurus aequoreus]